MAKALTVISKIIGVGAAGLMLYDAGNAGKIWSDNAQGNSLKNRLPDQYLASTKLDTESAITSKIKKETFKWQLDWNVPEFFASIKGFIGGSVENLAQNIIPAALATGAVFCGGVLGKGGRVGRSLGKLCALGLVGVGAKRLIYDVWGVGKNKAPGSNIV